MFRAPKSKVAKSLSAGDNAVIAIRPEQISLGTKREVEGKGFDGRVLQVTFLGDQTEYHVQTEEAGRLLVRMGSGHASFVSGDPVIAYWKCEAGLALLDE